MFSSAKLLLLRPLTERTRMTALTYWPGSCVTKKAVHKGPKCGIATGIPICQGALRAVPQTNIHPRVQRIVSNLQDLFIYFFFKCIIFWYLIVINFSPNAKCNTAEILLNLTTESSNLIRLVDGGNPYEGRVEVMYDGTWGTVCDDSWSLDDAMVVCRQLNYGPATRVTTSASFGSGSGPIHLDNVACNGQELTLQACSNNGVGVHNCNHGEDAGAVCTGMSPRLPI